MRWGGGPCGGPRDGLVGKEEAFPFLGGGAIVIGVES